MKGNSRCLDYGLCGSSPKYGDPDLDPNAKFLIMGIWGFPKLEVGSLY